MKPYTRSEDEFIRAQYGKMYHADIARRLRRQLNSVRHRATVLGVRSFKTRPFTKREDAVIRRNHGKNSAAIGKRLGRAPLCVRQRARRLGLPAWSHGRTLRPVNGYAVASLLRGGRRLTVHRAVIEKKIGRRLNRQERVHHINTIKSDNRTCNLHLFRNGSGHSKAHFSLNALLPSLLRRRLVVFDRVAGVYKLGRGARA